MSEYPAELRYTRDHEWVRRQDDGSLTVGITDHAQEALGDLVFVDFPTAGTHFEAGEDFAVVESVKAASDLYAPVAGTITEVNDALGDAPEKINQAPYGEGWIAILAPDDDEAFEQLLDADAYREVVDKEND